MITIQDEYLPYLLIALHDTGQMLTEACPNLSETERVICAQIEQWEQALLMQLANIDSSITSEKLIASCRKAPPQKLMQALIAQQEALRTLSEENYFVSLGGFSPEDAAFWNEGGNGYWAIELGKAALRSTWWPYYSCLRAWADTCAGDILAVLKQAEMVLRTQADCQMVRGVIEPCLQHVTAFCTLLRERNPQRDVI